MSGGINKLFQRNPQQFMTTHIFNTQPHTTLTAVPPGIHRLNLMTNGTFGGQAVTEVQKAAENRSIASHAFKAYYLPWRQGGKPSVQLGVGADYFFTAAITGCRLIIDAGPLPLVTHVDGGHYNDVAMDAMCAVRSNGANFGAHRYWDNGDFYGTVVVGVRNVGGWLFYAQNFDYSMDGIPLPLNVNQV